MTRSKLEDAIMLPTCFFGAMGIWFAVRHWEITGQKIIAWLLPYALLLCFVPVAQAADCEPSNLDVVNAPCPGARGVPHITEHPRTGLMRWEAWFCFALTCSGDTLIERSWPMRCDIGEPEPEGPLQARADAFGSSYLAGQKEEHSILYTINADACAWMADGMSAAWERFVRACLAIGEGITAQQVQAEWAAAWEPLPVDSTELAERYAQLLGLENVAAFIAAVQQYVEEH